MVAAADKKTKVRLADYGSLGLRGQPYSTWLPFGTQPTVAMPKDIPQVEFNKANPSRTFFVADMPPPPGVSGLSETFSEAKGEYDQSQKDSLDLKEATVLTDEDQRTADVG